MYELKIILTVATICKTDSAWSEIMTIRLLEPVSHRESTFDSIFRRKRQDFSHLPAYCVCEPSKPTCSPGPSGPVGEPGVDGGFILFQTLNITFDKCRERRPCFP
uniref:Nematode cuticle collagen N-terminal domain-containing protein n=1 Tax=Parascaris equorum TaxID=6256 RepID=A0A914RIX4_PAREQ